MPFPGISITELKNETLDFFKKLAVKNKRIDENILNENNENVLENLKLLEKSVLKRAAVLLFHPDPEKFVTGAFIKIGYFQTDTELIFQDEVHGNLFEQVEKTTEILFTKYIKAIISYEGIHRIETYEYPKEAIREALLNAIAHKDYAYAFPIQISVYNDKLMIWNEGRLPENWTVEKLLQKHSSKPRNPEIANAFFRAGYIEAWGRGTIKIAEQCQKHGLPTPEFKSEESDFWVTFKKDIFNERDLENLNLNERQIKAVLYVKEKGKISNKEYQILNNVLHKTAYRDLEKLVEKTIFIKKGEKKGSYYILNR